MTVRPSMRPSGLLVASIGLEATAVVVLASALGQVGTDLLAERAVAWPVFALLMALFVVLRATAGFAAGTYGATLGTLYRRRALTAAVSAPPDHVRSVGPGAALMKALDVESVGDFFARTSTGVILGAVESVAAFVVIAVFQLPATMVVCLATAIVCLVVLAMALARARARWRLSRLGVTTETTEGVLGLETAQVFERAHASTDQITARLREYGQLARRMDLIAVCITVLPGLTLLAMFLSVFIAAGTSSEASTAIGLGAVLLSASGLERLAQVSNDAVSAIDASRGVAELRQLGGVTSSADALPSGEGRLGTRRHRPADAGGEGVLLRASDITATYSPGEGLTDPVSLTVRDGDRLIIGAPSGFGKTTFGEVLSGERAPTSGAVWRRDGIVVARVPQADDDHMFANSLLFNVAAGVEWPPGPSVQTRVGALLDELGLDELLRGMPAGLAQPIGEGGWRLSTGERTRISLASALLREPDLLILDESIATLDGATRQRVLDACTRHSRATVLFAHV
ncbi:ATP-binding cassette domain-containing protein [Microbacterium marinilacus]|uniref:ABC transporter ATP-binding protein n=1 Tax=Microbacterium marinilacus TaxID=415209 RepID=A0ABP7BP60_9MICO|nr:ABC transporter ATP-binding protein [Microbacterium marinilacus]MBY0690040.1 ABC transporter ATP-binding protein/permease [Microbacterium marinilacus]